MALSKEMYAAFEDVVGAENICDDPAIMPAYHNTKFAVVILPKDTAQVQSIIKLCNNFKLQFRPICTGWSGKFVEGTVLLDLRRMNHIIEINEKNMYAVVEPYVISSQLQAECMKRGLTFCVKGAGTNCSAMLRGHGHLDQSTGGDDRNHLAIEWVTPEGEIVKSGALGSTDEWFCGDGPGPSLRSILTSAVPPGTTPGVFTKGAVKLYHWSGPAAYPIVGKSPKYTLKEIPQYMQGRWYSFPTIEKMWNAELTMGENEICFELMGLNASMMAANITTSNEACVETFEKMNKEALGPGFYTIIMGHSAEDFEFKKKAIAKIVADNNGQSMKFLEDKEMEGILMAQTTRVSASIRETFRAGGAFKSIPIMGQRDLTIKWAIGAGKAKMPLIKDGHIVDDGGGFFGWGVEQGHLGKTEIFCLFSPANPVAQAAVEGWQAQETDRAFRENYFASTMSTTAEINKALGGYFTYWEEITKAMDPNGACPAGGSLV